MNYSCVLHGSFRKNLTAIKEVSEIFTKSKIAVLAPSNFDSVDTKDGFVIFRDEENLDPRLIELNYLQKLKKLGKTGFSYFVNPGGILGISASYELGVAQTLNVPCFFLEKPKDHPAYIGEYQIITPETLAFTIANSGKLPEPQIPVEESKLYKLWTELVIPSSVIAVGAIIEYESTKEILLVKTHKWGNRFSIIGGKVRRNERLADALLREVKEESSLDGVVGDHLCTFDQIKNSGYYQSGVSHVYVDNVVHVNSKTVELNEEAEEYIWAPAAEALEHLDIEPNARHTLEIYAKSYKRLAGDFANFRESPIL